MAKRRLETMSPDLAARLPAIRDKWLKIGLMTGPADRAAAWEGMKRAYELAGRKPPTLQLWFESPFAAVIACAMLGSKKVLAQVSAQVRAQVSAQVRAQVLAQVSDQVRAQVSDQVRAQAYQFAGLWWLPGQFYDAYWLSYYDALRDCCSFEKLEGLIMVCENSAFAWTFPDIVIFCDRPVRISRDDRGRLHHESRAAVDFADGWGVHAWHGVRCEADVIERPEAITVKRVDTERNAEIRRVMIERFGGGRDKGGGPEAYLTAAGAKVIDHEEGIGTLRRREIADDEPLVMVDVVNSTREPDGSFKRYSLRVPPNITKAREAVAWTFGKTAAQYRPQIET